MAKAINNSASDVQVFSFPTGFALVNNINVIPAGQEFDLSTLDDETQQAAIFELKKLQSEGVDIQILDSSGGEVVVLKTATYLTNATAYRINTEGNQNVSLSDSITDFASNVDISNFYDSNNNYILLEKDHLYHITLFFRFFPTSDQNSLQFSLNRISNNSEIGRVDASLFKLGVKDVACSFPPFIVNSSAMDGIELKLNDFKGGTGAKIYNIEIKIQKLS